MRIKENTLDVKKPMINFFNMQWLQLSILIYYSAFWMNFLRQSSNIFYCLILLIHLQFLQLHKCLVPPISLLLQTL